MKIMDMHIHMWREKGDPLDLLGRMEGAGVYGGCIFSRPPLEYSREIGCDFEDRLEEVLEFCKESGERLYPILWIHPDEEDILHRISIAVQRGICGFKIICNNFYIYEERCLKMLRLMAELNKPVFFHSGILWDGQTSSQYNRPLNFEALLLIPGLRFSMGHCSWPWVDECIALYGKFMNAGEYRQNNAEMFFDLTPGTPEVYREDLLKKLFMAGYDVENNLMFGTDNLAESYSIDWAQDWLEIDRKIMDRYGVSKSIRDKIYRGNLLRFLGIDDKPVVHSIPTSDNAKTWTCENPQVKAVIRKWADKLGLLDDYRLEIEKAIAHVPISDAIDIDSYCISEPDGRRNLLSALFMCEALSEKYAQRGIPEQILLDTLADIGIWLNVWSDLKNELYLGEMGWLKRHLNMEVFRLGRLEFAFEECYCDVPMYQLKKGDPIVAVHIPADGPLTPDECDRSFALARQFFETYYPEYKYSAFTCHSWLLDPELKTLLDENSNIIQLQNRFVPIASEVSDAILRYVFRWNTTARNLKFAPNTSSFAKTVKKSFIAGTQFHESFGIIMK